MANVCVLLDCADEALHERVDERLQVLVEAVVDSDQIGEQLAPQDQAVHVLPVVDGLVRLLLLERHGVAQMDGQLTYVDEDVLVGELRIARVDFDERALHEVDQRQRVHRRELGVARKWQVQVLQQHRNGLVDNLLMLHFKERKSPGRVPWIWDLDFSRACSSWSCASKRTQSHDFSRHFATIRWSGASLINNNKHTILQTIWVAIILD